MELWDLYDANRALTGETLQRGQLIPAGRYHLVVHVAVFDHAGRMLIQQRQPFKEGWPNLWDITVGGSALAGESSPQAAEREMLEEIGLKIDLSDAQPVLTIFYDVCFDDVYVITREVDPASLTLQYEEVQAVRWATEEEVLRMLEAGTFIPYHRGYLELLFRLRTARGVLQP
ncbi:MAG: NUDIX domain-containing protein [Christensenellaceae bacterium]|nr:NUDIX domain-containing protein [Christensenellaceae bacterium]